MVRRVRGLSELRACGAACREIGTASLWVIHSGAHTRHLALPSPSNA